MTDPVWDNGVVRLFAGDCRDVLARLPAESCHVVVTSPPYWGLRDYGLEPSVWGGDPGCRHEWGESLPIAAQVTHGQGGSTLTGGHELWGNRGGATQGAFCRRCGAWLGTLGLEPTPEAYLEHIVEVFRAVWRVMRKDGTLWLNMGDSYGTQQGAGFNTNAITGGSNRVREMQRVQGDIRVVTGLKPKDLLMMPARVALALQADGWWLRQDIIWAKPNPMPESTTDRPTTAHEHLFLLAKSERYYYDADAIREPHQPSSLARVAQNDGHPNWDGVRARGFPGSEQTLDINKLVPPRGRNKRSVWTIAAQPYPEAHFATFAEKLVEPCVLAGSSERGVCAECGAPWRRVVEKSAMEITRSGNHPPELRTRTSGTMTKAPISQTTGWEPTCGHNADVVPATILDCFSGSGTVGVVAQRLGRRAVLVDASKPYLELARRRLEAIPLPMGV